MTLDIQPHETRYATEVENAMMELYGYSEMYQFKRDDGEESVKFSPAHLLEFCPRHTVSEFIELDTLKHSSIWLHCVECWNKGIHPTWINTPEYREWKDEIAQLLRDERQKSTTKYMIRNAKQKYLNPWKFVRILPKAKN